MDNPNDLIPPPALSLKDLEPAPIAFLEAETPLRIDLYLYMPLNQKIVSFRKRGETLTLQEVLNLTRTTATKIMVRKDDNRGQLEEMAAELAGDLGAGSAIPGRLSEFAGDLLHRVSQVSGVAPAGPPKGTLPLLEESSVIVNEVLAQYKDVNAQKLFKQFIQGLDRSGDVFETHNRHVSALSVLGLLALGNASMEEVFDLGFAARVHDTCLEQTSSTFADKHLSGRDLSMQEVKLLSVNGGEVSYRTHIELIVNRLRSSPSLISPFVFKTVEQHHENYDGSGMFGLKGNKIYRLARILRIIDDLTCLISSETAPRSIEAAFAALEEVNRHHASPIYDPDLLSSISEKFLGLNVESPGSRKV